MIHKIHENTSTLFSVPIHKIRLQELINFVLRKTKEKHRLIILPMNVHILTQVATNPSRLTWYKNASCVFADGVAIRWLCKAKGQPLPERISGTDLVEILLHKTQKVFLLGSTPNVLLHMKRIFSKGGHTPIAGTYSPIFSPDWNHKESNAIIRAINKSKARIVFVGVGHPKQELWIIENYMRTSASVFIAVGSAFDILSGTIPRAPTWLQATGFEWIWRIILEPRRLSLRYVNDIFLFILLIYKKHKKKFVMIFIALLLGFVFTGLARISYSNGNLVQYRADAKRTGYYSSSWFPTRPKWWRIKTNGLLTCDPIVANGKLYVTSWESDTLFAYDEQTGERLWEFTAHADLPFSPTIFKHTVYIGSVDGHLYALDEYTGKIKWVFASEDLKSFTSHPLVVDDKVIMGSRDGNLYAINWKTGKMVWKFASGGMIESSPIEHNGKLYFGNFNGKIFSISVNNGKKVWEYKTGGEILSSPALEGNTLVIGSHDTFVYAIDINTHSILWKSPTNGPVDATPSIANGVTYINSLQGKVYALRLSNGKVLWEKSVPTGAHAGFALNQRVAYFGSSNGTLYAFNSQTGNIIWQYQTTQSITAAPTIVGNNAYVTSGWYTYVLNKNTGKPYNDPSSFVMTSVPKNARLHEPVEFSLLHEDGLYENPWNEASVSAVFVSETGTIMNIDGFYYDRNQWRVRFAPPSLGKWSWTIFVRPSPSSEHSQTGSFLVEPSDNPGFLQISKTNPFRLEFANGTLFHPIGIGNKILDTNDNGYPLDDLALDENTKDVRIREYARVYGKNGAGFNLFRWSIDNASFPMWISDYNPRSQSSALWETYPVRYGLWGDELVQTLKNEGFHVWLTLWSFFPNVSDEKDLKYMYNQSSLETYIRYMVARYGAYVDVWELSNEAVVTTEWIRYVATILKSLDPYHHPVTINWERPDLNEIDIVSPHWYESEPLAESDVATVREISKYTQWKKPIIFGEQGNKYVNWDEESGTRMRVRLWTAFFNNASLIFWNTNGIKNYTHNKNANVYIGENERAYVRVLNTFTKKLSSSISPIRIDTSNPSVRSYGLQSENSLLLYLFNFGNINQPVSTNVMFTLPKNADITWINPINGEVLRRNELVAGQHVLPSPYFTIDVALKASFKN